MNFTLKLTYQIGQKSTEIEKSIVSDTEQEAHEAVYELFLKWFKYHARGELDMSEQDRTQKRDEFESEFLNTRKDKYEKIKFLENRGQSASINGR